MTLVLWIHNLAWLILNLSLLLWLKVRFPDSVPGKVAGTLV